MLLNSFINEIISEPEHFRNALDAYPVNEGEFLRKKIKSGDFQNIIFSGHGSSYNSLYPAFLKMNSCGYPAQIWQTAELLHYGIQQINPGTLLIINSQSGQSAEAVRLMDLIKERPAALLSITNSPQSVLAQKADIQILLNAGNEEGVATKTYLNALGLATLLSYQLCGEDIAKAIQDFRIACEAFIEYLQDWKNIIQTIEAQIGSVEKVIIVGRGPSMATAMNAALNFKEAARLPAEGMNAGEFRHGPLELADEEFTLFIVEGHPATADLNANLARDVVKYGSHVFWIGNHSPEQICSFNVPIVPEIARPLAELFPMQLITSVLAAKRNLEPGKFRHIGKIVINE